MCTWHNTKKRTNSSNNQQETQHVLNKPAVTSQNMTFYPARAVLAHFFVLFWFYFSASYIFPAFSGLIPTNKEEYKHSWLQHYNICFRNTQWRSLMFGIIEYFGLKSSIFSVKMQKIPHILLWKMHFAEAGLAELERRCRHRTADDLNAAINCLFFFYQIGHSKTTRTSWSLSWPGRGTARTKSSSKSVPGRTRSSRTRRCVPPVQCIFI